MRMVERYPDMKAFSQAFKEMAKVSDVVRVVVWDKDDSIIDLAEFNIDSRGYKPAMLKGGGLAAHVRNWTTPYLGELMEMESAFI